MKRRLIVLVFVLVLLGEPLAQQQARAAEAPGEACFTQTGFCVRGIFLQYWVDHGGLALNGFPISNEFTQRLEDGNDYTVQYFERVRMEYHPENPPENQVLLGAFGRKFRRQEPPVPPSGEAGSRYFPETGHNVPPGFLAYWSANGGLAQFGYPLAEVELQELENGQKYYVQYFERARLEYHPENADDNQKILLGQFGRVILSGNLPELLSLESVNRWCGGRCGGKLSYAEYERVVVFHAGSNPKNCVSMALPQGFSYDGWDGSREIKGVTMTSTNLPRVCDIGIRHA